MKNSTLEDLISTFYRLRGINYVPVKVAEIVPVVLQHWDKNHDPFIFSLNTLYPWLRDEGDHSLEPELGEVEEFEKILAHLLTVLKETASGESGRLRKHHLQPRVTFLRWLGGLDKRKLSLGVNPDYFGFLKDKLRTEKSLVLERVEAAKVFDSLTDKPFREMLKKYGVDYDVAAFKGRVPILYVLDLARKLSEVPVYRKTVLDWETVKNIVEYD